MAELAEQCRISEVYLREIMHRTDMLVNDIGSILDGYDAVRCGLIDEIGGVKEAIKYLKTFHKDDEKRL